MARAIAESETSGSMGEEDMRRAYHAG
jgi:hypothetical protein